MSEQAACEDCHGETLVWRAPDLLWNLVIGGPEAKSDPGAMLCPNCFIRRAEAQGIKPIVWLVDYN